MNCARCGHFTEPQKYRPIQRCAKCRSPHWSHRGPFWESCAACKQRKCPWCDLPEHSGTEAEHLHKELAKLRKELAKLPQ